MFLQRTKYISRCCGPHSLCNPSALLMEHKRGHRQMSVNECEVKVIQLCPTLCDPMDYTVHEILQARIQPIPSPGDFPYPGIEPRSPTLQVDSLPAELPGKPRNTGVGSLSLLQWIFPTQELNQGLLHCRQILCQLSYHGSPLFLKSQLIIWMI